MIYARIRNAFLLGAMSCLAVGSAQALPLILPHVEVVPDAAPPVAAPSTAAPTAPTAENSTAACTDGVDNDGDGQLDCADPDCRFVFACSKAARRTRDDARRAQMTTSTNNGEAPVTLEAPPAVVGKAPPVRDDNHTGNKEEKPPQLVEPEMPRLFTEEELPRSPTGGTGRAEILFGAIATPAAAGVGVLSIPIFMGKIGDSDSQFAGGIITSVFGVGMTVASTVILIKGVRKRDAYRKTEKLLERMGMVPAVGTDLRTNLRTTTVTSTFTF